MDWYRVTKTIRGRKYDYWQKTYRVGRSVKTLNKYIGPHVDLYPTTPGYRTMTGASRYNARLDKTWDRAMYWKNAHDILRAHEAKLKEATCDHVWIPQITPDEGDYEGCEKCNGFRQVTTTKKG